MTQELYALGVDRSAKSAITFLDHFLPQREACSSDYPVPESSDNPKFVLKTEKEILIYLEEHKNESYGLYWNNTRRTSLAQAMLFFTQDGQLIYGLAEDTNLSMERLHQLITFVKAKYYLLGSEQRPPDTATEFIALCKMSSAD